MESKDKFLMLTKTQKKSGRVYLTEGQLGFLASLAKGKDVEIIGSPCVPDLAPPSQLQELKAYDDSEERLCYSFDLTNLLVYKIVSYCKQNKIVYKNFFEDLLKHSPANNQTPSTLTTISAQLKELSLIRMKDIEMAKIGLINAREADSLLGYGRGFAGRGVCKKELKSTRLGSLHYFKPSDLEKYAKSLKKRV